MTELLSREEYAAIAATLDLPQRAFIDGGFRDACGGRTFASTKTKPWAHSSLFARPAPSR
ncbi:hypothetical protein ACET44_28310, partial [Pseudomonas aeruginosa]|uniref:hypothetical protein n=1 Tax=Pseudomonas aeruginosa TaxID=287 RepID=UPI0036E27EEB